MAVIRLQLSRFVEMQVTVKIAKIPHRVAAQERGTTFQLNEQHQSKRAANTQQLLCPVHHYTLMSARSCWPG